ncbi:MAG TPA: tetratricopeptide repeat protein [Frankiaceae bacterium]|jgi:tetratricopeptide (TPR) repeat protein|nr:tetratricopeptide repeat protein [Frankiaceae bacterium]
MGPADDSLADTGHALALRADDAYERGDADAAIELYRRALADGVDDVALRLGNLLAERGDVQEATAAYRHAIDRGDPVGWRNLALTVQDDDPAEAERCFTEAATGGDTRSRLLLGELLADLGRDDEAVRVLRLALDEGEGEAATTLGLLLLDRGEPAAAEEAFRRGVALDAPAVAPYLGVLLRDTGRGDDEVALYRSVLAHDPAAAAVLLNLGNVLAKGSRDDRAEAERAYRQAAANGLAEAFHNLGLLLEAEGREREARAAFEAGAAAGDERAAGRLAELTRP